MSRTVYTRRHVLGLGCAAATALAGCAGDGGESGDGTTTGEGPSATDTDGSESDGLDLREANVVGVTVESTDGGYRFDVTLVHDDDGEDGYADWWQVETLGGERLGRRDLAHPHGTSEFTRSTTVSVPAGTTCVAVRGHDQTHGYGGQAVLVDVETGDGTAVRQGPERKSVADREC